MLLGGFVWVVEEKLIAVGIVDDQEAVAPRAFFDRYSFTLKLFSQRVEGGGACLWCGRVDVERNEENSFADLAGPGVSQKNGTARSVDLGDTGFPVFFV